MEPYFPQNHRTRRPQIKSRMLEHWPTSVLEPVRPVSSYRRTDVFYPSSSLVSYLIVLWLIDCLNQNHWLPWGNFGQYKTWSYVKEKSRDEKDFSWLPGTEAQTIKKTETQQILTFRGGKNLKFLPERMATQKVFFI